MRISTFSSWGTSCRFYCILWMWMCRMFSMDVSRKCRPSILAGHCRLYVFIVISWFNYFCPNEVMAVDWWSRTWQGAQVGWCSAVLVVAWTDSDAAADKGCVELRSEGSVPGEDRSDSSRTPGEPPTTGQSRTLLFIFLYFMRETLCVTCYVVGSPYHYLNRTFDPWPYV